MTSPLQQYEVIHPLDLSLLLGLAMYCALSELDRVSADAESGFWIMMLAILEQHRSLS